MGGVFVWVRVCVDCSVIIASYLYLWGLRTSFSQNVTQQQFVKKQKKKKKKRKKTTNQKKKKQQINKKR